MMCSWKRSIGPTSRRATATIEVPDMENIEPNDPSLALCQICANCGEIMIPVFQDGEYHRFSTCTRFLINGCNDFIPGNIRRR